VVFDPAAVCVSMCVGGADGAGSVGAAGGVSARVMRFGAGWRLHHMHVGSLLLEFCFWRQAACMGL